MADDDRGIMVPMLQRRSKCARADGASADAAHRGEIGSLQSLLLDVDVNIIAGGSGEKS